MKERKGQVQNQGSQPITEDRHACIIMAFEQLALHLIRLKFKLTNDKWNTLNVTL